MDSHLAPFSLLRMARKASPVQIVTCPSRLPAHIGETYSAPIETGTGLSLFILPAWSRRKPVSAWLETLSLGLQ
jgi:hypothetical protein